ncbi:jg16698 [Pararge aegeria aegeria]|uniref:Jg16698 protein n=1 Tax=Pararge aegeria aegeria TaxID=348720 RepID=A0A8S4RLW6_9NEOP|nr:jg16698 [Pararge aegeria aegeria]
MDLAETMKNVLAKSSGGASGAASSSNASGPHGAEGYVTEKLYMLLQLYLQNKGWSPSIELLQCFSDLKESSMLPSAAYLQEFEACLFLVLEYLKCVVESYTIGRDQFGMEKEFILEVVQNCPNPACRYYKNQLEMTQKSIQQHLSQQPTYIPEAGGGAMPDSAAVERLLRGAALPQDYQLPLAPHLAALTNLAGEKSERRAEKLSQQMLMQNRSLGHQPPVDKYSHQNRSSSHSSLESKSKHHYNDEHKLTDFLSELKNCKNLNLEMELRHSEIESCHDLKNVIERVVGFLNIECFVRVRANLESLESLSGGGGGSASSTHGERAGSGAGSGAGSSAGASSSAGGGQERVVRAFAELARNLQRMRPCVRPAMCKPYGKQSEQLQKIASHDTRRKRRDGGIMLKCHVMFKTFGFLTNISEVKYAEYAHRLSTLILISCSD